MWLKDKDFHSLSAPLPPDPHGKYNRLCSNLLENCPPHPVRGFLPNTWASLRMSFEKGGNKIVTSYGRNEKL